MPENMRVPLQNVVGHSLAVAPLFRWGLAFFIAMLVAAISIFPSIKSAAIALLIGWAITGPRRALQALFISWLLISVNGGLSGEGGTENDLTSLLVLRWGLIAAALIHPIVMRNSLVRSQDRLATKVVFAIALLVLFNGMNSWLPSISVLKLLQFGIWLFAIVRLFDTQESQGHYWNAWLTTFFLTILLLSVPLAMFDAGYIASSGRFQGLMNQPQALGVLVAPLFVWFLFRLLFNKERRWPIVAGAVLSLAYIFMSSSRNSAIAAILSVGLTLILIVTRAGGAQARSRQLFAIFIVLSIVMSIPVVLIFAAPELLDFFTKGEGGGLSESFHGSRGALIEMSWQNFLEHPVFGIGFGIPSNLLVLDVVLDPVFGLPVSASVEKGVLFAGMLEENGVIGSIVLAVICFVVIRKAVVAKKTHTIALVLACLLVNIGEAILFSMGGMGFIIWLMIAFARISETANGGVRSVGGRPDSALARIHQSTG